MATFIIERNFAEQITIEADNPVIKEANDQAGVKWLYSFLSLDRKKTYCLYEAPNAEAVYKAAELAGVPADNVMEVNDPAGPAISVPA